ncbi:DUF4268 domain-containing protein [Arenimonas terrae]|nr:DUF4268 domain-containing protein [Arenimonas terrae]
MQPQRLLVPLFQRPYVWNEEMQWEPLWKDLVRVADRVIQKPLEAQLPHFLGAVVLQQMQSQAGDLQQRTVIDGQQRLTTLQLLLDALHAELTQAGAAVPAARLRPLIANDEAFRRHKEDQFKVWPTNRDREAFNEVMAAPPPVDYAALTHGESRMARAHAFFAEEAREWLFAQGVDAVSSRADVLERCARELLQLVVIDLTPTENAQEIFETLNARGSVLTAADLIKNFVFQRMLEQGANVEEAYRRYWAQFESPFWEEEVNVGRFNYPRSSVFLNHWLISQTGEEVVAREVFTRFKAYVDFQAGSTMIELLREIDRAAGIYRSFIEKADILEGPLDRLGLFAYRLQTMESEVVKPVLLALLDRPVDPLPAEELGRSLDIIESWFVRRMLIRATAKSYNKLFAEVASLVKATPAKAMAAALQSFFTTQTAETNYWPDDEEVRNELTSLPAYRRLGRGRLRMVLESIEDDWRGWRRGQTSAAGVRIRRGTYAIEHVLPQSWHRHWPLSSGGVELERDARIHRLGNLTLLSKKLNSTLSNGPWHGANGKAAQLQLNDVLLLNSHLLKEFGATTWDESSIDQRTEKAISTILSIWRVPDGHKVATARASETPSINVEIQDLMLAGSLSAGQTLHSPRGKHSGHTAKVLADGCLEVAGVTYNSASLAGIAVRKQRTNGWYFWRLEPGSRRSLNDLRNEYLRSLGQDVVTDDDTGNRYVRFWTQFSEGLTSAAGPLKPHKPAPQNWTALAIGRTGFWLSLFASPREDRLAVELVIDRDLAKTRFAPLRDQAPEIEAALGFELEWEELPGSARSRLRTVRRESPIEDESQWPTYITWLVERANAMASVLRDRIRSLP